MTLFVIAFIAGVLTVLAPCVLPLLPIIIGGSVRDARSRWKPFVITGSLALSIILFTLALKVSTAFIEIPRSFWSNLSGGILIFFGIITLFPTLWENVMVPFRSTRAHRVIAQGTRKQSFWGDVMIGGALGPVFSSCSPTYAIIIATVLPQSFAQGFIDLIAYTLGLSLVLLGIAFLGQKLTKRLAGAANPHGWFKRTLALLFLIVGVAIIFGFDKEIESSILDTGVYDHIGGLEQTLLEYVE